MVFTEQAESLFATQIAAFPILCDPSQRHATSRSPDGKWLAVTCGYGSGDRTLEIVNLSGQRWTIHFTDYISKTFITNGETGPGALYPKQWTGDGQYLYFTSFIGFDGGDVCYLGVGPHGLFRINLLTGDIITVLPVRSSPAGYVIAFSPGGRRLAYTDNIRNPVILDLNTGEQETIEIGDALAGRMVWSPDGSELAYASCIPDEDTGRKNQYFIKTFSLISGSGKTLLQSAGNPLTIESGNGDRVIKISTYELQTNQTSFILFDWDSMVLATATPRPKP